MRYAATNSKTVVRRIAPRVVCHAFLKDERAATAIEYTIIAAMLSIAIVAVVDAIGSDVNAMFTRVANSF